MFWNDGTEQRVRPHLALVWGSIMILLGVAGVWGFFQSRDEGLPREIAMSDAHAHIDEWVSVSDVRFDCEQVFDFSYTSNNVPRTTRYVVMSSTDGSVVALARYGSAVECRPVPAGSVWGTIRPLLGTGPLGHMREQGLQFPETDKPLLDFDTTTEPQERWMYILIAVIFLVTGARALWSGVRRTLPNRRGLRTIRQRGAI